MSVESTYIKKSDGNVYLRQVEKLKDVNDVEFTTQDKEVIFDAQRHVPQLQSKLSELQAEITDSKTEETRLINQITAIEAAVASKIR